jgi:uncharacterized protein (TIGR03086 family)
MAATDTLDAALATARTVLANVTDDQLSNPTPCASWDVRALVNHFVGGGRVLADAMANGSMTMPEGEQPDLASGDRVAAYDETIAQARAAFGAPGALGKTVSLPFGDMPGGALLGLFSVDQLTHAWDLAKATGQSTDLAPELAAQLLEQCKATVPDAYRGPEPAPFGPVKEAPAGASAADQLAAFLGRDV